MDGTLRSPPKQQADALGLLQRAPMGDLRLDRTGRGSNASTALGRRQSKARTTFRPCSPELAKEADGWDLVNYFTEQQEGRMEV